MKQTIIEIPFINLALSFLPILLVLIVFFYWKLHWKGLLYATSRMLAQLLLVGYFLTFLFNQKWPLLTFFIVFVMLLISAWISLYSIRKERKKYLPMAIIALIFGSVPVLLLVTMVVIPSEQEWYRPAFLIPLAGMVLSNSMNTIALAAERFKKEIQDKKTLLMAKRTALKTSLIPLTNSFFAVGMVAIPGMMTGQILSGVDPLLAVRYQIVVMTMVMGSGGLSAIIFIKLMMRSIGEAKK